MKGYSEPVTISEVYSRDPQELRDSKDRINPIMSKGIELFEAGRFEDALSKFQEAQMLFPQDLSLELLISSLRQTLEKGQKTKKTVLFDFR